MACVRHLSNIFDTYMKFLKKITFPPDDASEAGPLRNSRLYEAFPNIFPVFTYLVIMWCCVVYYMEYTAMNWDDALALRERFGGPIYQSPYHEPMWKFLTTVFFHDSKFMMHLLFNMMWIFTLGPLMERGIGTFKTVLFFAVTGFVSSAISSAISEIPGIGMSGIVYALVGFMWTAWPRWTGFLEKFNGQTVKLLIFWQLICFILTATGGYNVANAAHISGMAYGALIGKWACTGNKHGKPWMLLTLSFTLFGIACAFKPISQWF